MTEPRSEHLTPDVLEAFFEGTLPRTEMARAIAHLLEPCAGCRSLARRFGEIPRAAEAARLGQEMEDELWDEDEVWVKVMEAVEEREEQVAREWEGVDATCDELLAMPEEERRQAIETEERFQTWAVCERLLERAWAFRFVDPRRKLEVARAAVWVSKRLDRERYGEKEVIDLQARAVDHRANAHRILWDLDAAGTDLQVAHDLLKQGTLDPLEFGKYRSELSSYHARAGKHAEAFVEQRRTWNLVRATGSRAQRARVLIDLALRTTDLTAGPDDDGEVIQLLHEAMSLVEPGSHTEARLQNNLANELHVLNRLDEAMPLLDRAVSGFKRHGSFRALAVARINQGEIFLKKGQLDEAELLFKEARELFLSHGTLYDVGEIVLRFGHLYLAAGEPARAAAEIRPLLHAWESKGSDRNLTEALGILYKAASSGQLDEEALERFENALPSRR